MQFLLLLFSVFSCVICHSEQSALLEHQAVPYHGFGFRSHRHHQIRSSDSSTLMVHYKSNFIGIVNGTAHHAVIFWYSTTIFAVHQANRSFAINSQTRAIADTSLWSSGQNFEALFKTITKLDVTNTRNLTRSDEIHVDFLGLERLNCLETLLGLSRTLNRLKGVLSLVFRREGKLPVRGLVRFVNLVQTLDSLGVLRRINNFQQVLNSQNGLEGLRRVIEGMRNQNISRILGPALNNIPYLLGHISKMSQSGNPIDVVFGIVSSILVKQHGPFEVFIHKMVLLYQMMNNSNNQDNLNSSIAGIERVLQNQTSQSQNSSGLSNFLHFLHGLRTRSMNVQGIPVSQMIEFVRNRVAKGPMDFVVHILVFLRNQMHPAFSISRLFEFFSAASNSSNFGSSPISGLVHELQGQNMTELCRRISESLHKASNGTLNLESILNNQNVSKVGSELLSSILQQNHTALESITGQNNPVLGSILEQNSSGNGIYDLLASNLQNSQNTEVPNNMGPLLGNLEATTEAASNLEAITEAASKRKRRNHQGHHHHHE